MAPTTRGQTIKRARERHGYSQSVLAGLVGRSESWLSQVERGILTVDSHEILTRLARVMRLDLTELTGTDSEAVTDMRYDAARAIERAMMRYSTLETIVAETGTELRVDPASLFTRAHQTYTAYQAARYDEVGRRLPRLIREAEVAAHTSGADRPAAGSAISSPATPWP